MAPTLEEAEATLRKQTEKAIGFFLVDSEEIEYKDSAHFAQMELPGVIN